MAISTLEEKTQVMLKFEEELAKLMESYSNEGLNLTDIVGIIQIRVNAMISSITASQILNSWITQTQSEQAQAKQVEV